MKWDFLVLRYWLGFFQIRYSLTNLLVDETGSETPAFTIGDRWPSTFALPLLISRREGLTIPELALEFEFVELSGTGFSDDESGTTLFVLSENDKFNLMRSDLRIWIHQDENKYHCSRLKMMKQAPHQEECKAWLAEVVRVNSDLVWEVSANDSPANDLCTNSHWEPSTSFLSILHLNVWPSSSFDVYKTK